MSLEEIFGVESVENTDELVNFHMHTADGSNVKQPDAIVPFKEYVRRAVELGHRCVSTCEHGSSGDLLDKFYWKDKCGRLYYTLNGERLFKAIYTNDGKYRMVLEAELEPLGAIDFELINYNINLLFVNEIYFKADPESKRASHLVVISTDKEGMETVNKVSSNVVKNKDGFWGISDLDKLKVETTWISSACLASPIRCRDESDNHNRVFDFLYDKFGDHLLLEIQANSDLDQLEWNKELLYKSRKYGLDLIAGCDSHYIYDNRAILRTIILGARGITYGGEDNMILDYPDRNTLFNRFKQQNIFSDDEINKAINKTLMFVDGTKDLHFDFEIKIPSLYKNPENEKADFLKKIYEGIDRLTEDKTEEKKLKYIEEIQMEASVVFKGGMLPYLMTAHNIIKLAQDGNITIEGKEYKLPVGMKPGVITKSGRGSGGSSLVNNCLEFTTLDRLESEVPLLFERFISLDRLEAKVLMD